jgi:hypothetical protein
MALWSVVVALVGAPMLLTEWRKRRVSVLTRRIALTDALHGQLSPIAAPKVKKLPWGPWEIQIAAPLFAFTAVDGVFAVLNQVLSGVEDMGEGSYRVVLRVKPVPLR